MSETFRWDNPDIVYNLIGPRKFMWREDTLSMLASWIGLKPGMTVADIGCGLGYLGYSFWSHFGEGGMYVGLDQSASLIAQAQDMSQSWAKNGKAIFVTGNALDIPIEDDSFDVVMGQTIVMHLPDPLAGVKEMLRILKPGGKIVCIEPHNINFQLSHTHSSLHELSVEEKVLVYKVSAVIESVFIKHGVNRDSIGNYMPLLLQKGGAKNIDIRANDSVSFVVPHNYQGEKEQHYINEVRNSLLHKEKTIEMLTLQQPLFLEGGGTLEEFQAFIKIQEKKLFLDAKAIEEQLLNQDYFFCGVNSPLYITIAEK